MSRRERLEQVLRRAWRNGYSHGHDDAQRGRWDPGHAIKLSGAAEEIRRSVAALDAEAEGEDCRCVQVNEGSPLPRDTYRDSSACTVHNADPEPSGDAEPGEASEKAVELVVEVAATSASRFKRSASANDAAWEEYRDATAALFTYIAHLERRPHQPAGEPEPQDPQYHVERSLITEEPLSREDAVALARAGVSIKECFECGRLWPFPMLASHMTCRRCYGARKAPPAGEVVAREPVAEGWLTERQMVEADNGSAFYVNPSGSEKRGDVPVEIRRTEPGEGA